MGIVSTIPEKCRRCYTCVRECPAKAIKVEGGQAMVIEERCIACGNCVKVCAQGAKRIEDGAGKVRELLAGKERTFACLAPSFPAAFNRVRPGKVIAALRELGFDEVWEVAFGAQLVGREYVKLFEQANRTGATVITTPCPAIVSYLTRYMPSLHDCLAPIVSPMIATGRAIRRRHGARARIAFIGPCIAKKNEIRDPCVAGIVDAVLTFKELDAMFTEAGIDPAHMRESAVDSPPCRVARSFPISGGLLRTAGLSTDILENETVITEGKDRVLEALHELAAKRSKARLFDVLFCEGCINGPKMLNDLSVFARKEILADFVNEQNRGTTQREVTEALAEFESLDLGRAFTREDLVLRQPGEQEIERVLQSVRKFRPEDQLNCGACGYRTCRDKAIAVCQGLAEAGMCLPYLVEELEDTCVRLQESHQRLSAAQQRLVVSERLASMGQLSAAVAHEINNPLGTVLIYSHMLLRELQEQDAKRSDIQMIVSEATRCKNIIRGLLDFARQSRVSRAPTDLAEVIRAVVATQSARAQGAGVRLSHEVAGDMPLLSLDEMQIKQALINLVDNGRDAIQGAGNVVICARMRDAATAEIRVTDDGRGMSEEHAARLFTPFFTTKEAGKGTGLGLPIVYGIVKMHRGEIFVDSKEGQGTTVTILLPVGAEDGGGEVASALDQATGDPPEEGNRHANKEEENTRL
jgi:two-component system NtrC family sensor kinase